MSDRFDRNILFFGKEGQNRLRAAKVVIVGIGGLGTHVVQQLAYLGVGNLTVIDDERVDDTNLNRYVGARPEDAVNRARKVDLGERIAHEIDPSISVNKAFNLVPSNDAFHAIKACNYVFGCLDNEGGRLILNELCAAYCLPYFDLASEIHPEDSMVYGGRVCAAWDGGGCLMCMGALDVAEAQMDLSSPEARRNRKAIYGVERAALDRAGPSVVSINGVVASLGVTEFFVAVTGIRLPKKLLVYRGHTGIVTVAKDPLQESCYYCGGIRGLGDEVDITRFLHADLTRTRYRGLEPVRSYSFGSSASAAELMQ